LDVKEYYDAVSVVARDDRAKLLDYLADSECGVWLAYCGAGAVGCILYHPLPAMGPRAKSSVCMSDRHFAVAASRKHS
jgi:hypothetical protein